MRVGDVHGRRPLAMNECHDPALGEGVACEKKR